MVDTSPRLDRSLYNLLKTHFGYDRFLPLQEDIIANVLARNDTLVLMPTGGGKSMCYQLPALHFEGLTLVISPLIALMKDQVDALRANGVAAELINSTLPPADIARVQGLAAGGHLKVLYLAPERLARPGFRNLLRSLQVSLIAIDEAHCISEWGHDFRPAYMRLGARMQTFGQPALLALTATATPRIRETIVNSLRMRNERVIASSPHRSNLAFEVLRCSGDERARALVRLALRLRRPGIVYCSTRGEVDFVYALLRRFDIPAHRYHGGMTTLERNSAHERFMGRGRTVMVATNAFGLGIDKPDIRYVLHYQTPASLEQYVQEAGRGGRDGKRANGILLYDNEDRTIHEALLQRSRVRPDQLYRLGKALAAWAEDGRTPTLEALALSAELGPRIASALLVKIEEAGIVTRQDDEIIATVPADVIEPETRNLAGQFETLRTQDGRRLDSLAEYTNSGSCRAVFLRGYFGEEDDARCGLCDVCIGGRSRPANFLDPLKAPKPPRKKKPRQRQRRKQRQKQHAKHVQKQDMKQDPNQDQGEGRRRRRRRRPRRRRRARAESGPTAQ